MQGTFCYWNPTKVYFGQGVIAQLNDEIARYGNKVLLVYGKGSIQRIGLYDRVVRILKDEGKRIVECAGVMPNPTRAKLREGIALAKSEKIDWILAVGGGSVCDYAKALSVGVHYEGNVWDDFFSRQDQTPSHPIVPLGCLLTMAGTGSEMNGGSVITDRTAHLKIGRVFGPEVYPKFSFIDPSWMMSLPLYQVKAGIFDTMSHLCEQYFSGSDENVSDYMNEGLMRALIRCSRKIVRDPMDVEARSNFVWTATCALNTYVGLGKSQDWMVHMIGHAIGAHTHATHGMTLSAVSIPYYETIMPLAVEKFARWARNVWHVSSEGRTRLEVAKAGIEAMRAWMQEVGVTMNITRLGVSDDDLAGIVQATVILHTGYKDWTHEEIFALLRKAQ